MNFHRGKKVAIGLCILSMWIGMLSAAMATTISINPGTPEPASEITFMIDVHGENVSEVWIVVGECRSSEFCYPPQNISMEPVTDTEYEKAVMLQYDDSTYINYYANIKSEDGWEQTESVKLYLSAPSNGNGSTNGDGTSNTPGFEGVLLLLSLVIVVSLVRKKKRVQ